MSTQHQISDQERIRGYVVNTLINRFTHLQLDREQIGGIAKDVLAETDGIADQETLDKKLHELVEKHPALQMAEAKEWDFKDHELNEQKLKQLTDLLHSGDLDQTVALASKFEQETTPDSENK